MYELLWDSVGINHLCISIVFDTNKVQNLFILLNSNIQCILSFFRDEDIFIKCYTWCEIWTEASKLVQSKWASQMRPWFVNVEITWHMTNYHDHCENYPLPLWTCTTEYHDFGVILVGVYCVNSWLCMNNKYKNNSLSLSLSLSRSLLFYYINMYIFSIKVCMLDLPIITQISISPNILHKLRSCWAGVPYLSVTTSYVVMT